MHDGSGVQVRYTVNVNVEADHEFRQSASNWYGSLTTPADSHEWMGQHGARVPNSCLLSDTMHWLFKKTFGIA